MTHSEYLKSSFKEFLKNSFEHNLDKDFVMYAIKNLYHGEASNYLLENFDNTYKGFSVEYLYFKFLATIAIQLEVEMLRAHYLFKVKTSSGDLSELFNDLKDTSIYSSMETFKLFHEWIDPKSHNVFVIVPTENDEERVKAFVYNPEYYYSDETQMKDVIHGMVVRHCEKLNSPYFIINF